MNYVKHFNILGIDAKQIPCTIFNGPPTSSTEGAVGTLGMDVNSESHDLYKCVEINNGEYVWELVESGSSDEETLKMIERLNYYGNKDIVPTNNDYFDFRNGTVSITASPEVYDLSSIILPYKDYNGSLVTKIGSFSGLGSLYSIIIPNTILEINNTAFNNCYSLRNVIIPDSVTSIGRDAFYDCMNLTKIIIPDSVTSIGESAFGLVDNLTIICNPGSTAEAYAKENNIKYAYNYIDSDLINRIEQLEKQLAELKTTIK